MDLADEHPSRRDGIMNFDNSALDAQIIRLDAKRHEPAVEAPLRRYGAF